MCFSSAQITFICILQNNPLCDMNENNVIHMISIRLSPVSVFPSSSDKAQWTNRRTVEELFYVQKLSLPFFNEYINLDQRAQVGKLQITQYFPLSRPRWNQKVALNKSNFMSLNRRVLIWCKHGWMVRKSKTLTYHTTDTNIYIHKQTTYGIQPIIMSTL